MTEKEFQELNTRIGSIAMNDPPIRPPRRFVAPKPRVFEGPISLTLTLHGHCPSKKNSWRRGSAGKMFLDSEVKAKIDVLTAQALFQWGLRGPIENPELSFKFFVSGKSQDRDNMATTVLDCMQAAGVLVNDNIKRNNGRMVIEPCEIVETGKERVEVCINK